MFFQMQAGVEKWETAKDQALTPLARDVAKKEDVDCDLTLGKVEEKYRTTQYCWL